MGWASERVKGQAGTQQLSKVNQYRRKWLDALVLAPLAPGTPADTSRHALHLAQAAMACLPVLWCPLKSIWQLARVLNKLTSEEWAELAPDKEARYTMRNLVYAVVLIDRKHAADTEWGSSRKQLLELSGGSEGSVDVWGMKEGFTLQ